LTVIRYIIHGIRYASDRVRSVLTSCSVQYWTK